MPSFEDITPGEGKGGKGLIEEKKKIRTRLPKLLDGTSSTPHRRNSFPGCEHGNIWGQVRTMPRIRAKLPWEKRFSDSRRSGGLIQMERKISLLRGTNLGKENF